MESIWNNKSLSEPKTLKKDLHDIDTVVIGAGMCGILTAHFLAKSGQKVIVVEANRIGSGQTKNTTAKITAQHGLFYSKLIKSHGFDAAQSYANANTQAIHQYIDIASALSIPCDMQITPSFLYTNSQDATLEEEYIAASSLKIDCNLQKSPKLPFHATSSLAFRNQAQFNPMPFLYKLAENLTIYENSRVINVKEHSIITEQGTISAANIVFATHYPFINIPGFYFLRMHQERSYVIAIENADILNGMYYGIDADGLSFRNYNSLMLVGGFGHRTGKADIGNPYRHLQKRALKLWPNSKVIAHWSAQDCVSIDDIPYIGRYSNLRPYWYVATGFKKWGMSTSMVAAGIISDLILRGTSEHADIFAPSRKITPDSYKNLGKEIGQASIGLSKTFLTYPLSGIDSISPGEAKIIHYKGRKIGVYKAPDGTAYPVSVKCPHLGCALSWNPHDLSWDCPCHGSRFDYHGNLIDNPAQTSVRLHSR